ncbi:MAG: translation initiation factor IF-2, partial [Alistipes communis]|nr:translation initiation factor IF-2 [Alistipes communis]
MANERRIRLIQVAKEFNVGINTITDFLQKKGVKSDGSPNALVDAETYALLEKEFGAGRAVNSERVNIRERIAQKQATVTLDDDAKGKGGKNDEELLVKSNVISVKDEVAAMSTPKILGKIDLSGKKPAAAPAEAKKPELPSEKSVPAVAPAAEQKPAPAPAVKSEPVSQPAAAAPKAPAA